ncbi:MAG: winged helix-turn-helix transcriptional regulator [Saprospiraceae bacterium]|nr:winged helix-turn-helix transcriptional regulator [Saprospiraceae bacterium]
MHNSIFSFFLILAFGFALEINADSSWTSHQGEDYFFERVNLALRKAADQLLNLAGDSTSMIPPVRQIMPASFSLRLEGNIAYDSLPDILENALSTHGINMHYLVSIKDCDDGQVLLGYSRNDLYSSVPCVGRDRSERCFQLDLIFPSSLDQGKTSSYVYYLALIGCFLIGLIFYQKVRINPEERRSSPENKIDGVCFGNTIFDSSNQLVVVHGTEKTLTFRESKLLSYFLKHQNQLLERDQILSEVWGDEGILVGRSLDVFVSRLRKLLRSDNSVKITNVHGVGYRFEVGRDMV